MRLRALLLLAPLAAVLTAAASAQPADPDSVELGEVTVTATRVETAPAEAPVRVQALGREAAEAAGARTVADLVEARTGAFVRRYGPGGLATASLRGASASQTLVLLDGHRIADPQLGQLDLSLLPTLLVDRAEVVYGPGAALHGTDGVGGVLNLRTDAARPGHAIEARAGAWGEAGVGVRLAAEGRPRPGLRLGATGAADLALYAGDYAFFDSTRFDNAAGRLGLWVRREDADEERATLFGRAWAETGRLQSAAGVWLSDAERGLFVPGAGAGQRQWDRSLRAWTGHTLRLGPWRVEAGGLAQRGLLAWTPRPTADPDSGVTRSVSGYLRLSRAVAFGADVGATVTAGVEGGATSAEHPSLRDDARERQSAAFASAAVAWGRLGLYPALRLDRVRTVGDEAHALWALSPALGLNVRAAGPLRLKASARRAFRAPTFNDRFWGTVGDPALRPETAWTVDAGAALPLRLGRLRLDAEATAFASAVRDQIVWRPGAGGAWRPENVGRVRARGVEGSAEVKAPLPAGATLRAAALATWTDARDRTAPGASSYDQPLLYVPNRQLKGSLSVGWRALALDLGAVHTGRRVTASDGSASLGPVTVWDAGVRVRAVRPSGEAAVALRVENLTSLRYQIVRGYPMPPRHLSLRLTLTAR